MNILHIPLRINIQGSQVYFKKRIMKKTISTLFFSLFLVIGFAQEPQTIIGKVTDGNNPMSNVNVTILEKEGSAITNAEGKYEIQALVGDKLKFSYTGMRTITIKVEDVTRILNPVMIPDITELDEVMVVASKRRSQNDMREDYTINKNIIRTAWGYLDADRASGNIRILSEEEINPISVCILDLLRNRFPGIRVIGSCTTGGSTADIGEITNTPILGGYVFIRGSSSITNPIPAVYDVDGQIFSDTPTWLDVTNIRRLAILGNLATTNSYGNLGKGGVIVINTVNGTPKSEAVLDRARLKNNFADGRELSRAEVAENGPTYLKELRQSNSFEASKGIFEKYRATYSSSPYFLMDAYSHFVETHDQVEYADGIIEDHFVPFTNNPVLMKALGYIYDSQQRFEKSNGVYKEVFIRRPNYVQSYMDMANSYRNLNQPKQAASMYARYEYLMEEGFLEQDTIGFGPILEREFNNLLMLDKAKVVNSGKGKNLFIAEEGFKGTRLVFEWNDGEAEFDLQFVNPQNQYHKWKHSIFDNADEIQREKDYGFSVKEYLVDGSLPGTWQVNVKYLGNKSLTPSYLKATVYHDYGSRNQRKEVKVFKLDLKNVNQELFKVTVGGKLVSR